MAEFSFVGGVSF